MGRVLLGLSCGIPGLHRRCERRICFIIIVFSSFYVMRVHRLAYTFPSPLDQYHVLIQRASVPKCCKTISLNNKGINAYLFLAAHHLSQAPLPHPVVFIISLANLLRALMRGP
jgi:hypothetical protein